MPLRGVGGPVGDRLARAGAASPSGRGAEPRARAYREVMGAFRTLRDVSHPLWPCLVSALLGAWLFASAFLWPHQDNVRYNDWLCGLLTASSALVAVWAPAFRKVATGTALLVVFAVVIFGYRTQATRLHDLVVAALVLVLSMVPASRTREAVA